MTCIPSTSRPSTPPSSTASSSWASSTTTRTWRRCLAEHGEAGPAVGAIFDGTGLGSDGSIWGGEFLRGDLLGFERLAHLRPVRLPGGERGVRQPWRMASSWLAAAGIADARPPTGVDPRAWGLVGQLVESGLSSPLTSSVGRLFDAVAALCGLRGEVSYEGQAAIELEAVCDPGDHGTYDCEGLDMRPVVRAVVADLAAGIGVDVVAARFHDTVAEATARACAAAAESEAVGTVVLAGGVFQNRRLLERTVQRLKGQGLRVLVPEQLPPNDGAIAYGQAAVAAATVAAGRERCSEPMT